MAMNEATFRRVNEALDANREDDGHLKDFVCECGRLGCTEFIKLTGGEYDDLRADGRRFAIVDGHEVPEVERVVKRRDRYTIVEKLGLAGAVADSLDPRPPLAD